MTLNLNSPKTDATRIIWKLAQNLAEEIHNDMFGYDDYTARFDDLWYKTVGSIIDCHVRLNSSTDFYVYLDEDRPDENFLSDGSGVYGDSFDEDAPAEWRHYAEQVLDIVTYEAVKDETESELDSLLKDDDYYDEAMAEYNRRAYADDDR